MLVRLERLERAAFTETPLEASGATAGAVYAVGAAGLVPADLMGVPGAAGAVLCMTGFLASCMVEIAPGIFTSPTMSRSVRERIWAVFQDWFGELGGGSVVMTWRDPTLSARQGLSILGLPPRTLIDTDGVLLVKGEYRKR